jgi:hypothetical protein
MLHPTTGSAECNGEDDMHSSREPTSCRREGVCWKEDAIGWGVGVDSVTARRTWSHRLSLHHWGQDLSATFVYLRSTSCKAQPLPADFLRARAAEWSGPRIEVENSNVDQPSSLARARNRWMGELIDSYINLSLCSLCVFFVLWILTFTHSHILISERVHF